jgi:uracil-DNA glycosylase
LFEININTTLNPKVQKHTATKSYNTLPLPTPSHRNENWTTKAKEKQLQLLK